jgi:hypothetical protein
MATFLTHYGWRFGPLLATVCATVGSYGGFLWRCGWWSAALAAWSLGCYSLGYDDAQLDAQDQG